MVGAILLAGTAFFWTEAFAARNAIPDSKSACWRPGFGRPRNFVLASLRHHWRSSVPPTSWQNDCRHRRNCAPCHINGWYCSLERRGFSPPACLKFFLRVCFPIHQAYPCHCWVESFLPCTQNVGDCECRLELYEFYTESFPSLCRTTTDLWECTEWTPTTRKRLAIFEHEICYVFLIRGPLFFA